MLTLNNLCDYEVCSVLVAQYINPLKPSDCNMYRLL
jgi:hypothetical protein